MTINCPHKSSPQVNQVTMVFEHEGRSSILPIYLIGCGVCEVDTQEKLLNTCQCNRLIILSCDYITCVWKEGINC